MTRSRATTLAADFAGRRNSLGLVRLVLAVVVVVGHSWQLGGYGPEPAIGTTYLSTWALYGFFAVSGFLILRSRMSRPRAREFYWARFLRIYPGFVVCLLVVALVFAPVSLLLDGAGGYSGHSAATYVLRNLALYPPVLHQEGIDGTLGAVPFARNWDEPMWSLFYEASCYVFVGVLVSLVPRRFLPVVVPVLFGLSTLFTWGVVTGAIGLPYVLAIAPTLLTPFLAGSTLCALGGRLPAARWDVGLSALALVAVVASQYTAVFSALPLAHLLIRSSTLLPFPGVGRRWDVSYGVYIYGVPVQQLVSLAFPDHPLPLAGYAVVVLAILLPVAFASSALVEMPALRLKSWRPARPMSARRSARLSAGPGATSAPPRAGSAAVRRAGRAA